MLRASHERGHVERIRPEDLKQNAVVLAWMAYNAANSTQSSRGPSPPLPARRLEARGCSCCSSSFSSSGTRASALVYQVLWLRKLGLVFGVTVYAASTVWASFMFGLAIGSLFAGGSPIAFGVRSSGSAPRKH